jgi:ATP-dependent DNA helicase RecQ
MLPGVPLVALTATADPAIQRDILSQLSIDEDSVFLASFDRPNLHLAVLPGRKRFEGLLEFIGNRRGQAGIVYCLSRAATEDLAEKLRQRVSRRSPITRAWIPPTATRRRTRSFGRDDIVCATVAFGWA